MDRELPKTKGERERERELCPTWDPLARINWGFRMNHSILRTHLCSPTFSSLPTAIIRRVRDSHTRVFLASQQLKVVLVTYFYYVLSLGLYASYSAYPMRTLSQNSCNGRPTRHLIRLRLHTFIFGAHQQQTTQKRSRWLAVIMLNCHQISATRRQKNHRWS